MGVVESIRFNITISWPFQSSMHRQKGQIEMLATVTNLFQPDGGVALLTMPRKNWDQPRDTLPSGVGEISDSASITR